MNPSYSYPLAPQKLPPKLTQLPGVYKFKVALAILSIILFFALYFSLVGFSLWLLNETFFYSMDTINKWTILLKISAVAFALAFAIFSIKFLFHLKNVQPANRIEVDLKKESRLAEFIENICKETGAPRPKKVFVDPDVNAYVSYSNVWLSLFFPTRKNLTIGLALVEALNLSELKAVVSHEFGHFAQRSMKIGSYIHSANSIIHHMVFTRDKWDEILDHWRALDIRLSFGAWFLTPVIWLVRQLMFLFYRMLNRMHSLLSQEMEFNADKVAVSTSGSLPIVSSLWKLEYGQRSWSRVLNNALLALKKDIRVKNLYTHNAFSMERMREEISTSLQALKPDDRGGKMYFSSSANSKIGMYESHPPNDKRETNAKTPFVTADLVELPAWSVFKHPEEIQERMTHLVYKDYLGSKQREITEAAIFEQFIVQEIQDMDRLEAHGKSFVNRFIAVPDEVEIKKNSDADEGLEMNELWSRLAELMKPIEEIEQKMELAGQIAQGTSRLTKVEVEGKTYTKKQMPLAFNKLSRRREEIFNGPDFVAWDAAFCSSFYRKANVKGRGQQVMNHLNFHRMLTASYRVVVYANKKILDRLEFVQNKGEVGQREILLLSQDVKTSVAEINTALKALFSGPFFCAS